jgi:hypothetical protein
LADYVIAQLLKKPVKDCTPEELRLERKRIVKKRTARKLRAANSKAFGVADCEAAKSLGKRVDECTPLEILHEKIRIDNYRKGIGVRVRRSAEAERAAAKARTARMPDYYIRGMLTRRGIISTPELIEQERARLAAKRAKRVRQDAAGMTPQERLNEYACELSKRHAAQLTDHYIAAQLRTRINDLPPELLDLKRQQLKLHRTIRKINEKRI